MFHTTDSRFYTTVNFGNLSCIRNKEKDSREQNYRDYGGFQMPFSDQKVTIFSSWRRGCRDLEEGGREGTE